MEIEKRVLNVFSKVFDLDTNDLSVEMIKDDIESWDSIGHLQLIMNLESEFNIKFRTKEIYEITSIQKCIEHIKQLIKV